LKNDLKDLKNLLEARAKAEIILEMIVKIYANSGRKQKNPKMIASIRNSGKRSIRLLGVIVASED
jgi:hypothetical protein